MHTDSTDGSPAADRATPVARAAAALRRRALIAALGGELARVGAVALVASGTLILLTRGLLGWTVGESALLLGTLIAVPIVAWPRARRRVPSLESAATWLDLRSGGSGAVVATLEQPAGSAWSARATTAVGGVAALPALRVAPLIRPTLPSALFATVCLAMPIGTAETAGRGSEAVVERRAERLREQLEVLDEVVDVADSESEEFEDRIRAALEAAGDGQSEAALEALDRVELDAEALAERAAEAAQDALRAVSESAADLPSDPAGAREQLAAAAEALEQGGLDSAGLSPEVADALAELAAGLDALPVGETGAEGSEALGKLAGELAELAELADGLREELAEKLAALAEQGLLEGAQLPAMEIDPELLEALTEALENMELAEALCPPVGPGGT